jgi:hypothetical protein
MTWDWTVKVADLAIVFATLLGPVLAVQAQKWVERRNERNRRRQWIFETLMATRSSVLAQRHVEALNAIPFAFRGCEKIVQAWNIYLDHLNTNFSDATLAVWSNKSIDLFIALLQKMSEFLGYDFDEVELRKGHYFPKGHVQFEADEEAIRRGVAALLKGELALPMEVRGFPVDQEAIAVQKDLQKGLFAWLRGETAPRVRIVTTEEQIQEMIDEVDPGNWTRE